MKSIEIVKQKEDVRKYNIIDANEPCPNCGKELRYYNWASMSRGHAKFDCCGIELLILGRASDDGDTEEYKNFMNNIGKTHRIVISTVKNKD